MDCNVVGVPIGGRVLFPDVKGPIDQWIDQAIGHAKEENVVDQFLAKLKERKKIFFRENASNVLHKTPLIFQFHFLLYLLFVRSGQDYYIVPVLQKILLK